MAPAQVLTCWAHAVMALWVMSIAHAGELWSGGSGRSDLSVSDMRLRHSHFQEQPSMHTSSDA